MIAVVQRVSAASVSVEATGYQAAIDHGLCVLLGVEAGDSEAEVSWVATRLARLRIFADDDGKMNRSVVDVGGSILLVSQFTLLGDCSRGNRPSFVRAAAPDVARRLYDATQRQLEQEGIAVKTGVFAASMQVCIHNNGPVTLILERRPAPDTQK